MNEAETRAERIDHKLKACGWGVVEVSKSKKVSRFGRVEEECVAKRI